MDFALESRLIFLSEEQTEAYKGTAKGVPQVKIAIWFKRSSKVAGFAGKRGASVHKPDEVSYSAVSKCNIGKHLKYSLVLSIKHLPKLHLTHKSLVVWK